MIENENKMNFDEFIIHSDSMYVINCCTFWYKKWQVNGWITSNGKDVQNKEDIISVVELIDKLKFKQFNLKIKYVKGHSGVHGNEMADKLAKKGRTV